MFVCHPEIFVCHPERQRRISSFTTRPFVRCTQGDNVVWFAFCFFLAILFLPRIVFAQSAGSLQYQFQPHQVIRYRLDLQHEIKMAGGAGRDAPITTKITFQASIRMVESAPDGAATLEARAEGFNGRTAIGSKETVAPASAAGQSVQFRVGPSGLLPGQEALNDSSGLPWKLFLSQVFPDLTRCRYLGQAIFNGQPCARIGFDLNQGKGTALFADGRLISGETQGSADPGDPAKSTFSSRLSLLP